MPTTQNIELSLAATEMAGLHHVPESPYAKDDHRACFAWADYLASLVAAHPDGKVNAADDPAGALNLFRWQGKSPFIKARDPYADDKRILVEHRQEFQGQMNRNQEVCLAIFPEHHNLVVIDVDVPDAYKSRRIVAAARKVNALIVPSRSGGGKCHIYCVRDRESDIIMGWDATEDDAKRKRVMRIMPETPGDIKLSKDGSLGEVRYGQTTMYRDPTKSGMQDAGRLLRFCELGVFELLSPAVDGAAAAPAKLPAPSVRADALQAEMVAEIRAAGANNRHFTMVSVLRRLPRLLARAGLHHERDRAEIERMVQELSNAHGEHDPSRANRFHLDECFNVMEKYGKFGTDFKYEGRGNPPNALRDQVYYHARAQFLARFQDDDDRLHFHAPRPDSNQVTVWDRAAMRWREYHQDRGLEPGQHGLITLLRKDFSDVWVAMAGTEAPSKVRKNACEDMLKELVQDASCGEMVHKLDDPRNFADLRYHYIGDGKALRVSKKKEDIGKRETRWQIVENKPEYLCLSPYLMPLDENGDPCIPADTGDALPYPDALIENHYATSVKDAEVRQYEFRLFGGLLLPLSPITRVYIICGGGGTAKTCTARAHIAPFGKARIHAPGLAMRLPAASVCESGRKGEKSRDLRSLGHREQVEGRSVVLVDEFTDGSQIDAECIKSMTSPIGEVEGGQMRQGSDMVEVHAIIIMVTNPTIRWSMSSPAEVARRVGMSKRVHTIDNGNDKKGDERYMVRLMDDARRTAANQIHEADKWLVEAYAMEQANIIPHHPLPAISKAARDEWIGLQSGIQAVLHTHFSVGDTETPRIKPGYRSQHGTYQGMTGHVSLVNPGKDIENWWRKESREFCMKFNSEKIGADTLYRLKCEDAFFDHYALMESDTYANDNARMDEWLKVFSYRDKDSAKKYYESAWEAALKRRGASQDDAPPPQTPQPPKQQSMTQEDADKFAAADAKNEMKNITSTPHEDVNV